MSESPLEQAVIVSKDSMASDDPYAVVNSNISFLNALQEEHFRDEELSQDALRSYFVDFYLSEVENGGFSQFVYNSSWDPDTVRYVREGLSAMGAVQHLALFNKSASIVDRLGPDVMQEYLASDYFGDNPNRDLLNEFDDAFSELLEQEDLGQLNSAWLKSLPHLVVMTIDEMEAEIERRAAELPDRDERAAEALADEPRFMKLIRALCAKAGLELLDVTAGDPTHEHAGQPVLAWHFITDQGHRYMVEAEGHATMFDGDSDTELLSLEATDEYGED